MKATERQTPIDLIRGVAILGVILLHSKFDNRFDAATLSICAYLATIFDWAVLAFFFLSGALWDESQRFGVFLRKRFHSLLIPFFFYNIFYNIGYALLQFITGKTLLNVPSGHSLILYGWFQSPAFQLYFLPYLFGISIIASLLCKKIVVRWRWVLLVVCMVAIICWYEQTGWPATSHGPEWTKIPVYFMSYLFGVVGGPVLRGPLRPAVILSVLGATALAFGSGLPSLRSLLVAPLLYMIAEALPVLRATHILEQIGRSSGAIYLWHTPMMLPAFTTILALFRVPPMLNLGLSVILTVALCVFLRQAIPRIFKKAFHMRIPRSIVP